MGARIDPLRYRLRGALSKEHELTLYALDELIHCFYVSKITRFEISPTIQ